MEHFLECMECGYDVNARRTTEQRAVVEQMRARADEERQRARESGEGQQPVETDPAGA